MKLTSQQLQKLKKYFSQQPEAELVYLYGSFTEGATHPRSDIDFGILFNIPIKSFHKLGAIMSALDKLKLPAKPDVRYLNLKESPAYLFSVIKGNLIYCRNEEKRINFEVEVLKRYYDAENFRQIRFYYLDKRLKEGTYGY